MNVEIGTEAAPFLFWEYLVQIFSIKYLQCGITLDNMMILRNLERYLDHARGGILAEW